MSWRTTPTTLLLDVRFYPPYPTFAGPVHDPLYFLQLWIDLDNNPNTGCGVADIVMYVTSDSDVTAYPNTATCKATNDVLTTATKTSRLSDGIEFAIPRTELHAVGRHTIGMQVVSNGGKSSNDDSVPKPDETEFHIVFT